MDIIPNAAMPAMQIPPAKPTARNIFDSNVELSTNIGDWRELERYSEELNLWIQSPNGSRQLMEARDLQSRIPLTNRWQLTPADVDMTVPDAQAKLANTNEALARRHPQKLIISFKSSADYDAKRTGIPPKNGYLPAIHEIEVGLPYALNQPYATRDAATGEIVYRTITLQELLTHEMDHALQALRVKYGKDKEISTPCKEEKAVAAERSYTQYLNAKAPKDKQLALRQHYTDADAMLKFQLDKSAEQNPFSMYNAERLIGIPHRYRTLILKDFTPQQLQPRIEMTGTYVFMDSGCQAITDDGLIQRTRELLNNNGLNNKAVNDADMLKWIRQGINKELKLRGVTQ